MAVEANDQDNCTIHLVTICHGGSPLRGCPRLHPSAHVSESTAPFHGRLRRHRERANWKCSSAHWPNPHLGCTTQTLLLLCLCQCHQRSQAARGMIDQSTQGRSTPQRATRMAWRRMRGRSKQRLSWTHAPWIQTLARTTSKVHPQRSKFQIKQAAACCLII